MMIRRFFNRLRRRPNVIRFDNLGPINSEYLGNIKSDLFDAIGRDDVEQVARLLNLNETWQIFQSNEEVVAILERAAASAEESFYKLLEFNIFEDSVSADNNASLVSACKFGNKKVVSKLLQYTAVQENITALSNMAFNWAAKNKHNEIAQMLLKFDAVVEHIADDTMVFTCLIVVSNYDLINFLLDFDNILQAVRRETHFSILPSLISSGSVEALNKFLTDKITGRALLQENFLSQLVNTRTSKLSLCFILYKYYDCWSDSFKQRLKHFIRANNIIHDEDNMHFVYWLALLKRAKDDRCSNKSHIISKLPIDFMPQLHDFLWHNKCQYTAYEKSNRVIMYYWGIAKEHIGDVLTLIDVQEDKVKTRLKIVNSNSY